MALIKRDRQNWPDPFNAMSHLRDEMNKLFDRSLLRRPRKGAFWDFNFSPEVDLVDKGNQFIAEVDLPGLEKGDIDISLQGNMLIVKGERKEEHEDKRKNSYYMERRFGSFQRAIELPCEVKEDQIQASYKGGVLKITVPKCESAKPKQIKVDVK